MISLNNGWTIRNWIYTGILNELADKCDIMVLTPVKDDATFSDILAKRKLHIKASLLNIPKTNPLLKILRQTKDKLFYEINHVETQKLKRFEVRRTFLEKIASVLILVISKAPGASHFVLLLERLDNFLSRRKKHVKTLIHFKPDLFISTHPFVEAERKLIIEAHRQKIPILASILSWDNLFNKGMLPLFFDKIIVWSQIQKDRFLSFYPRYHSKQIAISGAPPFDIYRSSQVNKFNREEYLQSINIDPEGRILLYCTGPGLLFPKEPEIIAILLEIMDKENIPDDTHLLVRCHPNDDFKRYAQFMSHQRVTISKSSLDKESRDTFTWIPPENEMFGLMTMLKASQLCINIASTTSLDAAACGIPVINVAFDGYRKEKYLHSVRRFYDFSHYKDVVQTGAVKMVYNEQDLVKWISRYLEDPSLDQEKREKLISEQCWKLDGKASERVAEIVSDFVDASISK